MSAQAALFAGFLSAFLIELLGRLEPDPMDTIQDVLIYQTQMLRNSSLGPYVQPDFSPPEYIVVVNALFYASLGIMLLAAFIAMMIISWVREFDHGLGAISIPEQRAKTREFRYLGMERWKLEEMVAMLPLLIQISLLLFAIGLVLFLFRISKPSFGVTTAIFGVGVLYYAITTTISVFVTSSPFHSPLSRALGRVYHYVHAYFCPGLDEFLSTNMDIAPGTAFGRFRRRLQIFLQKSRPYLERDFVEPITAATVDDVQLSTAASALQRIHDSMPNSQHSALIQQSVWQVASSPALRMRPLLKLPSWILDDEEYLSRLSPASVIALTAIFVRMRDARYKKRIAGVEDICTNVGDSQGPRAQVVRAIFSLLPNNFVEYDYESSTVRYALHFDALLREVLPDTPSINNLCNSLLRASYRDRPFGLYLWYNFSLGRLWGTLRHHRSAFWYAVESRSALIDAFRDALRGALRNTPVRFFRGFLRNAFIGGPRLDDMVFQGRLMRIYDHPKEPSDLLNIVHANRLHEEDAMWLLSTLSELHCDGLVLMGDYASRICLAVLLHQVPNWNKTTPPSVILIEAVVALVAISSSSNERYQVKTLTNSRQYPWLLLNLRNPAHIRRIGDEIDGHWHVEVISILFLVIYALTLKHSKTLAKQYLAIITAKADFASCASALTIIAPALGDNGFRAIGKLLLSPGTRFSTLLASGPTLSDLSDSPHLRRGYLDPKIAAVLLLLSKDLSFIAAMRHWHYWLQSRDPWIQFAVNKIARLSIFDGPRVDMWSFHDHRVRNMSAAFFLLQYVSEGDNYSIPSGNDFLPSFLQSREPIICCAALYYSISLVPSPPSYDFSDAIYVVFNPKLPHHHLAKGWDTLRLVMQRFSELSVGWQQTFADAFFTQSRRLLPMGTSQNHAPSRKQELREILTWDYFCKEEHEPELTDTEFSGLDWMVAAWALHLSQQPSFEQHWVNESTVLRVLFVLLYSAPYYSVVPIVPKLREFVGKLDDPELSDSRRSISALIKLVLYKQQEYKTLFKFQKFNCMWYI